MTVTGNPAEFTVNGVAATVNSLTVPFSPIQDLNGYDHPWPAGGGENLLPMPITSGSYNYNVTVTVNPDLSFVINKPNGNGWTVFQLGSFSLAAGTYTIIESDDGSQNASIQILHEDGTEIKNTRYSKRNVFTLSSAETVKATFSRSAAATDVLTKIMLFAGDTKTADDYSPYANICPISGRTGLSVYVGPTQDQQDATTYAVDWTDEAGTVYGGTLDVVTGVLTVDRAMVDLGTLTWSASSRETTYKIFFTNGIASLIKDSVNNWTIPQNFICSQYKTVTFDESYAGNTNGVISYAKGNNSVNLVDSNFVDYSVSEVATALSGVQLCYELATPLTYQLSAQTINLLAGIRNYVWSDTNEDITISFDVAAFIRHLFRVNGVDFSRFVERDSYATALEPVYAETIQTMDGVNHTALLRTRGSIRLRFNPQTDSDTAALCSALLASPCEVQYRCLQRDVDVTALMCVDTISAQFLSRCLYLGDEWNQIESITLTEL